jgi:hypothetical protein
VLGDKAGTADIGDPVRPLVRIGCEIVELLGAIGIVNDSTRSPGLLLVVQGGMTFECFQRHADHVGISCKRPAHGHSLQSAHDAVNSSAQTIALRIDTEGRLVISPRLGIRLRYSRLLT